MRYLILFLLFSCASTLPYEHSNHLMVSFRNPYFTENRKMCSFSNDYDIIKLLKVEHIGLFCEELAKKLNTEGRYGLYFWCRYEQKD